MFWDNAQTKEDGAIIPINTDFITGHNRNVFMHASHELSLLHTYSGSTPTMLMLMLDRQDEAVGCHDGNTQT